MTLSAGLGDDPIAYLDTSSFIPLIVEEPGSAISLDVWEGAVRIVSTQLLVVETHAALNQAHRLGRLGASELDRSRALAGRLLEHIDLMEVSRTLVAEASHLTGRFPLRGFDAVHVAAAARFTGEAVMVSGDARVLVAARGLGLPTVDTARAS